MNEGHTEKVEYDNSGLTFNTIFLYPQTTKKEATGKLEIEDEKLVDRWLHLFSSSSQHFFFFFDFFVIFVQYIAS